MITRRAAVAAGMLPFVLPHSSVAADAPVPPSLEALMRPPTTIGAAMSPDGAQIAILREQREGEARTAYVNLISAADPKAPPRRLIIGDLDVYGIHWANNERLLISVVLKAEEDYTPTGSFMGRKLNMSVRRLLSVGLDAAEPVMMFAAQKGYLKYNYDGGRVIDLLPDDPRSILMALYPPGSDNLCLYQVDIYSGMGIQVDRGSTGTYHWMTQGGKPVLRWDSNNRGTAAMLYWRGPQDTTWKFVRRMVLKTEWQKPDFEIVGASEKPGAFYVVSRGETGQTAALREFDMRTLTYEVTVAEQPGRDIEDALIDDQRRFVAASYVEDRVAYVFADPAMAGHFRGIEAFLGRKQNVSLMDISRDHNRLLIRTSGPGMHSLYCLYDVAAKKLSPLSVGKPWLTEGSLATVEALDVKTRDGQVIRAYLTVPRASGPRPLVVMPHGGPETRDGYDFDYYAQAFAAQGWLVLQPNFRGSGGYGRAFAQAGEGRWGDRMQEDVEDAVAQVLASGRADLKRVAICGASYGGYAALMGAVRRPELYRGVISIAGVSDLPEMMEDERQEGLDSPVYQLWVRRIGDPKADAARLAAASPRRRVTEIKAPVLLIHGLDDDVVAVAQSRMMAQAMKSAGKSVELVTLRDAGHNGWEPEMELDVLKRCVDFLGKAFA
ncbi:MAG: S9 family peptidase [Phenylobacterium sp.]|uniref:alpha/beta hydrolase family protein n=1 Tax=Phenylobacterium sp. TaxID=1871053 RepID=UPI001B3CAD74|nr:S9 family peptidase [Phenylobacterium sp.]MBP7648956.1 S9 family peptidase [Phenylobacterium sp.]MBP7817356.1 S9 family peptidase [Phenylobacterium sp.]MBP9231081.1 S9 family peptidase [Phenylobacterium sp.]MBP9754210.1 S9 family peptidase [Phenylobacterium sp.]